MDAVVMSSKNSKISKQVEEKLDKAKSFNAASSFTLLQSKNIIKDIIKKLFKKQKYYQNKPKFNDLMAFT